VSKDTLAVGVNTQGRPQIRSHFPCGPDSVAYSMRDRAMEPEVRSGDIFVIDPSLTPVPGDLVLVRLKKLGIAALRRFSRGYGGNVILLPANSLYEEFHFTAETWETDAELLGVMSEHTRPRRT
jgi:SOS-response transcriptional repressor LexA